MTRFFGFVFILALLAVLVTVGVLGYLLHHYGLDLPDYRQLSKYEPKVTTRLYAGNGRLLREYAEEKRIFMPIRAIPRRVSGAFLSAEDKRFYHHYGIDFMGIGRAMLTNLKNLGANRRPVGASTITQQVARNFLLSNELSYVRKLKEAILTLRIERAFSKDHILELYLNEIFLGNRSYGVAAAAFNYFGKSLDELTIAEAAYLAALPKSPVNYDPVRHHDAAVARRNWVIRRMLEDGRITAAEARRARLEPLRTRGHSRDQYVKAGEYFAEKVRRSIAKRFGDESLYQGGLTVRTSMDPMLQAVAERSLRDGLIAYDRRHGWRGPVKHFQSLQGWAKRLSALRPPRDGLDHWTLAVVLKAERDAVIGFAGGAQATLPYDNLKWARKWRRGQRVGPKPTAASSVLAPGDVVWVSPADIGGYALEQPPKIDGALVAMDIHSGRVLAIIGGFSYQRSQFNRATQAWRQPGSAFKPFVYLSALQERYTPASLVLDAPFSYEQGPGLPPWEPQNYSGRFYGPTTLRVGLEKSHNLMTVRLANAVGMEKIARQAEIFSIDDHFPTNLAASLGAGETTLLRLTAAYATLADGGRRVTPTLIDRVQNRAGKTIYKRHTSLCEGCTNVFWTKQSPPRLQDDRKQIADQRSVYQIVHILEGVIQNGTGRRLKDLGLSLAGKSGTTNEWTDAWFIGFTPDLAVGAFVGFDQPGTLGKGETGSIVALPIIKDFLREAAKGASVRPFPVPSGLQFIRINHKSGLLARPGDRDVVVEAFKAGYRPRTAMGPVLDGLSDDKTVPPFMPTPPQEETPPSAAKVPRALPRRLPQAGELY